jgi:hypothetical protein
VTKFISAQPTVSLTAGKGNVTITGKFKPVHRVIELTDAQVALFRKAIDAALKSGVLIEPRAQE